MTSGLGSSGSRTGGGPSGNFSGFGSGGGSGGSLGVLISLSRCVVAVIMASTAPGRSSPVRGKHFARPTNTCGTAEIGASRNQCGQNTSNYSRESVCALAPRRPGRSGAGPSLDSAPSSPRRLVAPYHLNTLLIDPDRLRASFVL